MDNCLKRFYMTTADISSKLSKEITSLVKRSRYDHKLLQRRVAITYDNFFADKILMRVVIQEGVPYSMFNLIQHLTPFSEEDWAAFLDLSTKSMQRYKQQSKVFRPIQFEKIIEMAEVTKVGVDVFGDIAKFKGWLNTPSYALGNVKPRDLLADSYGKEMVVSELTRINYGIFV